mmetsp:Transcript_32697/g.5944  ORF Transcript_32697/g.5944 Transcript_32697/m.5944 type:complete len:87 (-) Transcript_32697:368-628(-)
MINPILFRVTSNLCNTCEANLCFAKHSALVAKFLAYIFSSSGKLANPIKVCRECVPLGFMAIYYSPCSIPFSSISLWVELHCWNRL